MAISLLLGFVGGVLYSAYQTPAAPSQAQTVTDAAQIIAALELQAQKTPEDPETWTRLGHAYFDSDQPQKAITAYEKVLEITPGNINIMTDLGVMYRRVQKPRQAIAMFDKVLEKEPGHPQARFNKGVVLLNDLNDKQAAIAEWNKLVQRDPDARTPSGSLVRDIITQLESQN